MFGNKGVIFIFDLILSLLVVVLILSTIFFMHPKENLNTKDLTFEGVKILYNNDSLLDDHGNLCRDYYQYNPNNNLNIETICGDVINE